MRYTQEIKKIEDKEGIFCDSCRIDLPVGQEYLWFKSEKPYFSSTRTISKMVKVHKICRFCVNLTSYFNDFPYNICEIFDEAIMRGVIQHRRNRFKDFEHEYRCFKLIDDFGLEWTSKNKLKEKMLQFNNNWDNKPFLLIQRKEVKQHE